MMFFFSIFIGLVGYLLALALGYRGIGVFGILGFFLVFAGLMNLISYYWSDRFVIALSGAKEVGRKEQSKLYRTVENLTIGAGLAMPKIYLIDDPAPNAFATGRNPQHAVVAVTKGLLSMMDDLELEGVIAHELSHIKNFDTRLMATVTILVGIVAILADFFLRSLWFGGLNRDREDRQGAGFLMILALIAAILAPIAAQLIQLAVSRKREFLADASGSLLTRYPEGLAKALEKIAAYKKPMQKTSTAIAHLYIASPFGAGKTGNWFLHLFNTHPPVEERVKILRGMK